MRKIAFFLIPVFLFAWAIKVSLSLSPSRSLGKKVLLSENDCMAAGKGCFSIISFRETKGIKDGIHYYMYFDAEIIFLKDSVPFGTVVSFLFGRSKASAAERMYRYIMPKDSRDWCETGCEWMVTFDEGEKCKIKGIIYFIKTEEGWQPTSDPLKIDEFKPSGIEFLRR